MSPLVIIVLTMFLHAYEYVTLEIILLLTNQLYTWIRIVTQSHKIDYTRAVQRIVLGFSLTDEPPTMWHIPAKVSSAQSQWAVNKNRCNSCVKLRRGFSQLSFMYVLLSVNIFLSLISESCYHFQPPLSHNK